MEFQYLTFAVTTQGLMLSLVGNGEEAETGTSSPYSDGYYAVPLSVLWTVQA